MSEIIQSAIEKLNWYIGDSWHHLVFLLALLYLIFSRREKENRTLFVGYSFLFFVIYFLPYTAKIIMYYCIGELVYWRMFWLLPIPMVLAYVCTRICRRFRWFSVRGICLLLAAALIALTGEFLYNPEVTPYQRATNPYKLPQEVIEVSDMIEADWNSKEEIKLIAPEQIGGYIRQYNANIRLLYGRRGSLSEKKKQIREGMEAEKPPIKKIVKYARKHDYRYFVYETTQRQDERLKELGFVPVGQYEKYVIYKDGNAA